MDASAKEKLQENPEEVPVDKRAALAALKDKVGVKNQGMAEKLDPTNKQAVLAELRSLSKLVAEGHDMGGVTQEEVEAVHREIEAPFLVSTRGAEQVAQAGLDSFSSFSPAVKQALVGSGVLVGGVLIIRKILSLLSLGWTGLKYLGKGTSNMYKKARSGIRTTAKYGFAMGASALAAVGLYNHFSSKKPDTPEKA